MEFILFTVLGTVAFLAVIYFCHILPQKLILDKMESKIDPELTRIYKEGKEIAWAIGVDMLKIASWMESHHLSTMSDEDEHTYTYRWWFVWHLLHDAIDQEGNKINWNKLTPKIKLWRDQAGSYISKHSPGGHMGFIRNIALETAIKKALLDVTSQIEDMGKRLPEISSFGELVMIYAQYSPHIEKNVLGDTWESTFYGMIANQAQNEMPSSYLIQDERELAILTSLVTEWVASKGGNVANIYKEFSEAGLHIEK